MSDFHQNFIKIAIEIYGLELDGHQIDTILATWLKQYDPTWILKAIVESLYRGRYKIVSVENILKDWQRLGNPRYKFTPEYEREILEKIPPPAPLPTLEVVPQISSTDVSVVIMTEDVPDVSSMPLPSSESIAPQLTCQLPPLSLARFNSEHLNPEESAPFQAHHHSLSSHSSAQVGIDREGNPEPTDDDRIAPGRSRQLGDPLQHRGRFFSHPERAQPEQIRTQPASCQLFNTLKAIVDPNHQRPVAAGDTLPTLVVGNGNLNNIASFAIPIDSPTQEQQV
jgi:hypothetical protein